MESILKTYLVLEDKSEVFQEKEEGMFLSELSSLNNLLKIPILTEKSHSHRKELKRWKEKEQSCVKNKIHLNKF